MRHDVSSWPTVDELEQGRPDRADEAAELLARLEAEIGSRPAEALKVISRTCQNTLRSGRQAKPIPQASFESVLLLIAALADGALEHR
jgi:hypothetical protein